MIQIVVAHARNRVIGRDGSLPWRLPLDMRHFRELTTGGTVLMGRKTFDSIPEAFRPLPGRRNLVLSGNAAFLPAGAEVFGGLAAALEACEQDCFVIGGEVTYRETLPVCRRIHATEIEDDIEGDAFFPELPEGEWDCVEESSSLVENELTFRFRTYERSTPL